MKQQMEGQKTKMDRWADREKDEWIKWKERR